VAHQHGVQRGVFVEGEVVLPENREALAGLHRDLALRGLDLPGQDFEKVDLPVPFAPINP
jgi:hypothetical protein